MKCCDECLDKFCKVCYQAFCPAYLEEMNKKGLEIEVNWINNSKREINDDKAK